MAMQHAVLTVLPMDRTVQFVIFGSLIAVGIWYLTQQTFGPVAGPGHQQSIERVRDGMRR